jgi:hypothetical protein
VLNIFFDDYVFFNVNFYLYKNIKLNFYFDILFYFIFYFLEFFMTSIFGDITINISKVQTVDPNRST